MPESSPLGTPPVNPVQVSQHLTEIIYESLYPAALEYHKKDLPVQSWAAWFREKIYGRQEDRTALLSEADDLEAARSAVPVRGHLLAPSRCRKVTTVVIGTFSFLIGGSSAAVYINSSKAAAGWIKTIPHLNYETLSILIEYMGPVANGLLNSELLMRITSGWTAQDSAAVKALKGKSGKKRKIVVGGLSLFATVGGLFPLVNLDLDKPDLSVIDKVEAYGGAVASAPSFLVGAQGALDFLLNTYQRMGNIHAFNKGRFALLDHLQAEIAEFSTNKMHQGCDTSEMTMDDLLNHMWDPDRKEDKKLETILPKLLNISQWRYTGGSHFVITDSNRFKNHKTGMGCANGAKGAVLGVLIGLRIMSLFGFVTESVAGGEKLAQKADAPWPLISGIFFALLTGLSQAGLSIRSLDTISSSIKPIFRTGEQGQALSPEMLRNPWLCGFALLCACIVGFFSGGTSAEAAHKRLGFMTPVGSAIFAIASYVTSGLVINGYFCYQLFRRMVGAYQAGYASPGTKRFTHFITGYRKIIDVISQMDDETYYQLINDNTIKPTIKKLYGTYGVKDEAAFRLPGQVQHL